MRQTIRDDPFECMSKCASVTAAAIRDVPLMSVDMRRHHGIGAGTLLTKEIADIVHS